MFIHQRWIDILLSLCIWHLNGEKQPTKKYDKRFQVISFATVEKWSCVSRSSSSEGGGKKLSQRGAEQQNKCFLAQVNFWRWHNNTHAWKKERYDSGCNIRNRFGAVSNHLSLSLITFDRAAVRRDIKVDSVTKLPQYGGTYEGILRLIFPPSSTFHLHKSTQTITSSHEYKAITDSLRVEIILTLLQRWYNYHANLAHQQFKTSSVIISRIKTPTKRKKRKKERGGKKKRRKLC